MYFWPHRVCLAVYGLSLVAVERDSSPVAVHGAAHCVASAVTEHSP